MCCILQGLLGDARHFKNHFSRPIEAGNDRHATERMRQVPHNELRMAVAMNAAWV